MPHPYRPGEEGFRSTYTLEKAARDGHIIVVRCNFCRRLVRFLATDLLAFIDPRRDAYLPPWVCSVCGKWDYLHVKLHYPSPGDYGHLTIRRPAGVVHVQKWKTVKLGDE